MALVSLVPVWFAGALRSKAQLEPSVARAVPQTTRLEPSSGLALVEGLGECEAMLVTRHLEVLSSSGFPARWARLRAVRRDGQWTGRCRHAP